MSVIDGEVLKAVAEFVLADGTIAQNIFHFAADFVASQTDAFILSTIQGYIEDIYDPIDTYVDSTVTVNPITVHVVVWDGVEGKWVTDRLIGYTNPSITFASGTDPQPNQISPVMVANTGRPKTRGRKFLLPFSDASADGSEWVSAVLTALASSLSHYIADEFISTGNELIVGIPRAEADAFEPFSDGIVNSIVGTQRRRKPGVGA